MLKIRTIVVAAFLLLTTSLIHPQNNPIMIGYCGGQSSQQAEVNAIKVSYGSGMLHSSQWKNKDADVATSETGSVKWMSGFNYKSVKVEAVFDGELLVSKGYYGDYVELKWSLVRYEDAVTGFLILRRLAESGDAFEQVADVGRYVRLWQDRLAEPNQLYEYKILAKGITDLLVDELQFENYNFLYGLGFRIPTGRVAGRITYESGAAVAGVGVVAETAADFKGSSLSLNGSSDFISYTPEANDPTLVLNEFTFQAWVAPHPTISAGEKTLMKKGDQYWITYQKTGTDHTIKFKVKNSTQTVSLVFPEILNRFFHVSAIRTANSLKLLATYDVGTTYTETVALVPNAAPVNNNELITIGHGNLLTGDYFQGNVDEIRIWNKALNPAEIENTTFRYIDGTEDGLSVYYRLNIGLGSAVYDFSRSGFSVNAHHGSRGTSTWSTKVPEVNQLSVKGTTDVNGYYTITGIPYASGGSDYRISPVFGLHVFEPAFRNLHLEQGSTDHINIDFTDVASFLCGGSIYYKGTNFPVKGVNVKIDGDLLMVNGAPYQSASGGKFLVEVPIGPHHIQFVKDGHVFTNGEFTKDFQGPYTLPYSIIDSTLIKVIGKVVGGPVQADKPKGLGKTVNNIGRSKIILSNAYYNYSDAEVDTTYEHPYYKDALEFTPAGTTAVKIPEANLNTVEITPDPTTGEYVAYLLPEIYTVNNVKAGWDGTSYTYDLGSYAALDLKNEYSPQTAIDSVIHPVTPFIIVGGVALPFYQIDSVNYNKSIDFIYRVSPSLAVTKSDGTPAFWDQSIEVADGTNVDVVDPINGNIKTVFPIFTQRKKYNLNIAVFENYINPATTVSDIVPVADGKVEITNNLATNSTTQLYQIDTAGNVGYTFSGGKPSFAGTFEQSLSIVSITGNTGSIRSPWEPTLTAWNGTAYALKTGIFKGILLGALPKGENYSAKGPDQVDMIIRDPYGSQSYASYEVGNKVSKSSSISIRNALTTAENLTVSVGAKVINWGGIDVGTIAEIETSSDQTIGMEATTTWLTDQSFSETITNTKKWQTSAEADAVGAPGDVFVGRAMNIVYGAAKRLELKATTTNTSTYDNIEAYDITPYETMRFAPEFSTAFQYSQNHIVQALIPELEDLKATIITGNPTHYSNFSAATIADPSSVLANTTVTTTYYGVGGTIVAKPVLNSVAFDALTKVVMDGDQYDITLDFVTAGAANYWSDRTKEFPDKIREYSEAIRRWKAVLARNEKEKLEAVVAENLRFDAGTTYSGSTTITNAEEITETFAFSVSPSLSGAFGGEVCGVGIRTSLAKAYKHLLSNTDGTTSPSSVTFSYEFSDNDEGDYYSIGIKKPKTATGPVFAVRGGQSQCPHAAQEVTHYYLPETELSAATEQKEVPTIACAQPIQTNVPGDQLATFEVQFSNNSQSTYDHWYQLVVDETTNPNGAKIRLDGVLIGNGKVIYIPYVAAGQLPITQQITIEQTNPTVVDYPAIKLILHSICQYNTNDHVADVADSLRISAHFIPVCASVVIGDPTNLWTRNIGSGASFDIDISGYDVNRVDFERMLLQYKPSSASNWSTAQAFYPTSNPAGAGTIAYNAAVAAGESAIVLPTGTVDDFQLDLTDQPDRAYDIRVKTECINNVENFSLVASGIKDMKPPKVFGTPQPSDGILSPGEKILLKFDEPITAELLSSNNFSVRGVLNGSPIRHSAALYFDGDDDVATTHVGIDYSNKSFAIEFWIKRAHEGVEEVIYSQNGIEIGYNLADKMVVTLAGREYVTTAEYSTAGVQTNNLSITDVTQLWMHYTVSYDAVLKKLNVYDAYDGHHGAAIDRADASASANFNAAGEMRIGNDASGTKAFKGYIHDFRVWEKEIDFGTSAANRGVNLNGDEIGLSGFWPMKELKGNFATDLSRAHHALLSGPTWSVFPSGHAYKFDGATTANFPTASSVVISNEMDFTLEMWFKADPTQKGKVLFSNGRTDGTNATAIDSIWEIGIDNNGLIYAKNSGERVLQETGDFMDDQWHHLAVVMRRKSNTSIYLDGALNGLKHSSFFAGLKGPEMTLGASRDFSTGAPYANHFTGSIDEFRIWKLARTKELINLDLNAQLKGNEIGLVAYYPFDNWDNNLLLVPSAEDLVIDALTNQLTGRVMTLAGGVHDHTNVPKIQQARPVQNLNYNWVVNGDELTLNILEQPSLIEKRTIELTVENVADTNQNLMASPETWTAYIKQNTVVWSQAVVDLEIEQYTGLTFNVDVINTGAIAQDFTISNLPSWLTASATSGTISPTSRQTITFSVGTLVTIGSYEEVLYLTTDFGDNERLHVQLKVVGERPDWTIDPTDFQYSMNIVGQVSIDEIPSIDVDDQVVALVNGEVRGIADVKYYAGYTAYLVFMDVYSNSVGGDSITFHIWDESAGKEHTEVTPHITFEQNNVVGTPELPTRINAVNTFYEPIPVRVGWNWISFPLKSTKHARINELLSNIESESVDILKGMSFYDQYIADNNIGWVGSLTASGGVNNAAGYKLKASHQDTIQYVGVKVDPSTVTMAIDSGWNWIGLVSQKNLAITDAFTNYTVAHGDLLKSQQAFAIYDSIIGWQGNLVFLEPKKGYMLKSRKADALTYPDAELFNYKTGPTLSVEELYAEYGVFPQNFQYNMSAIIDVAVCDYLVEGEVLLAYVNGEIRGAANIIANKAFLTIYGNAQTATLTFQVKVATPEFYAAIETMNYVPNAQEGTLLEPFTLQTNMTISQCDVVTSVASPIEEDLQNSEGEVLVIPTLFNDQLRIQYTLQENAKVTMALYGVTGQKMVTLMSGSKIKGTHTLIWNPINKNQNLSEGLYFLQISLGDQRITKKVVKNNNN